MDWVDWCGCESDWNHLLYFNYFEEFCHVASQLKSAPLALGHSSFPASQVNVWEDAVVGAGMS